ncbi:MAG: hypothetical protein AB2A00_31045 [Myxococcota bacterium]
MRSITSSATFAALFLVTTGCASSLPGMRGTSTVAYASPTARAEGIPRERLFQAVLQTAREEQWTVVRADPERGQVEALAPLDSVDGVPMREHWFFSVDHGRVTATRMLEVQFDQASGRWRSSPHVAQSYEYTRERIQLDRIVLNATPGPGRWPKG